MHRSWQPRRCFCSSGSAPSDGLPRLHRLLWRNRARQKVTAREKIAPIGGSAATADEVIAPIVASVAAGPRAAAPTDPGGTDPPIGKVAAAEHHRGEDHHVEIATANERSERTIPSKRWMDRGHRGGHVQR